MDQQTPKTPQIQSQQPSPSTRATGGSFMRITTPTKRRLQELIKMIEQRLGPTDNKEGVVYAATTFDYNDVPTVKVGFSEHSIAQRISSIEMGCRIPVGHHLITPRFQGAHRAEQIVHKYLAEFNLHLTGCCINRNGDTIEHHEWVQVRPEWVHLVIMMVYRWMTANPTPYTFGLKISPGVTKASGDKNLQQDAKALEDKNAQGDAKTQEDRTAPKDTKILKDLENPINQLCGVWREELSRWRKSLGKDPITAVQFFTMGPTDQDLIAYAKAVASPPGLRREHSSPSGIDFTSPKHAYYTPNNFQPPPLPRSLSLPTIPATVLSNSDAKDLQIQYRSLIPRLASTTWKEPQYSRRPSGTRSPSTTRRRLFDEALRDRRDRLGETSQRGFEGLKSPKALDDQEKEGLDEFSNFVNSEPFCKSLKLTKINDIENNAETDREPVSPKRTPTISKSLDSGHPAVEVGGSLRELSKNEATDQTESQGYGKTHGVYPSKIPANGRIHKSRTSVDKLDDTPTKGARLVHNDLSVDPPSSHSPFMKDETGELTFAGLNLNVDDPPPANSTPVKVKSRDKTKTLVNSVKTMTTRSDAKKTAKKDLHPDEGE